jgi:DNA helicase-2/ATP-dependent DNA helicase PcrA
MVFRKYDFEESQTRTMFFGSLVHRTLDDLHNFLIARRAEGAA